MPGARSLAAASIIDQRKISTILLHSEVGKQHVCDIVITFRKQDMREMFTNLFPGHILADLTPNVFQRFFREMGNQPTTKRN
jgi:hypothetical protein